MPLKRCRCASATHLLPHALYQRPVYRYPMPSDIPEAEYGKTSVFLHLLHTVPATVQSALHTTPPGHHEYNHTPDCHRFYQKCGRRNPA